MRGVATDEEMGKQMIKLNEIRESLQRNNYEEELEEGKKSVALFVLITSKDINLYRRLGSIRRVCGRGFGGSDTKCCFIIQT